MRTSFVALSCALLLLAGCNDPADPPATGSTPAGDGDTGLERVRFQDQASVYDFDVDAGREKRGADLASADAVFSRDGSVYAFADKGQVQVADVSRAAQPTAVGPGRDPMLSPDGALVAAVVTAQGYRICDQGEQDDPESCPEADRIVVYESDGKSGQEGEIALGAGFWTIRGWSDGHVVGLNDLDGDVRVGRPGDTYEEVEELEHIGSTVWGVSPVDQVVLVGGPEPGLYTYENDEQLAPLDAPRLQLGPGAWSPDGAHIALAVRERGGSERMMLIEVESGETTFVEGGTPEVRNVVWTEDGSAFAFAARRRPTDVTACDLSLSCETVVSFDAPVSLVSIE